MKCNSSKQLHCRQMVGYEFEDIGHFLHKDKRLLSVLLVNVYMHNFYELLTLNHFFLDSSDHDIGTASPTI